MVPKVLYNDTFFSYTNLYKNQSPLRCDQPLAIIEACTSIEEDESLSVCDVTTSAFYTVAYLQAHRGGPRSKLASMLSWGSEFES